MPLLAASGLYVGTDPAVKAYLGPDEVGAAPEAGGPTYRSGASALTYSAGNPGGGVLYLTLPVDIEVGDLLLSFAATAYGASTLDPPPGWTLLENERTPGGGGGNAVISKACYKIADADDAGTQIYWQIGSVSNVTAAAVVAYSGVDPVTPIDVHAAALAENTTPTGPSVTTTVPNTKLVEVFTAVRAADVPTITGAPGTIRQSAVEYPTGLLVTEEAQPAAGASGTKAASVPGTSGWVAFTVAVA